MLKPLIDFDWFGLPIYFITLVIGLWVGFYILKKQQRGKIYSKLLLLVSILLSFISASVFSWFLFPDVLFFNLEQRIIFGGMNFYAGMLMFFGSSALFRLKSADRGRWLHEVIPAFIVFSFFERLGASFTGFCYGVYTNSDVWFLHIFPAREIEAIVLAVMFLVSLFLKKHRLPLYLLCYSILRFTLEFWRGDDRGRLIVDFLSPTQVLAILTWVGLFVWILMPVLIPQITKIIKKFGLLKKYQTIQIEKNDKNEHDIENSEKEENVNKHSIYQYQPRQPFIPRNTNIRRIANIVIGLLIAFVWLNPFNINGIRIVNNFINNFTHAFSAERSVVSAVAENSAARAIRIDFNEPIKDIYTAYVLLAMHDERLGGEFSFIHFDNLSSGNSILYFTQTHLGIPIYGSSKQLILDSDGKPLYVTGTTIVGIDGILIPDDIISYETSFDIFNNYFIGFDTPLLDADNCWYYMPELGNGTAYRLAYTFSSSIGDTFFNIIIDAQTGIIIDVVTSASSEMSHIMNESLEAVTNILQEDYLGVIRDIERGNVTNTVFSFSRNISVIRPYEQTTFLVLNAFFIKLSTNILPNNAQTQMKNKSSLNRRLMFMHRNIMDMVVSEVSCKRVMIRSKPYLVLPSPNLPSTALRADES